MTKVIIDEKYHIESHDKGHTLYSKLKSLDKEGRPQYKVEGYYRTLEKALEHTAKLKVLSSHSELEIGKYLRELKQAVNELTKVVQE